MFGSSPHPSYCLKKLSNWEKAVNVMLSRRDVSRAGREDRLLAAQRCLYASPHDLPANIGRGLLEHSADVCHVFAIEYRFSKHIPDKLSHPFPAALFDVYLTGTGLSPETLLPRATPLEVISLPPPF